MKYALCIILGLIMISSAAYSKDLTPGTISVSGATGASYGQTTTKVKGMDDLKTDVLSFNLNGEYYIMDNLGIGVIFMYDSVKQDIPGSDDRLETSTRMVGPQIVYNVAVNEQMSVPVFVAFGSASTDDGTDTYSGWAWALGGGLRYFVTDRISFDGYLYYDSMSLENDIKMDMTDVTGQVGISIYLGGM
jgi:opacity protein-like surface antigen